MCGIAAIVTPEAARLKPALAAMLASLDHRGPDARGTQSEPDCLLGHTRLSIIDAEGGKQPMLSPDGQAAVIFNGELYDYRARKLDYDYPFQTQSDTELVLAAYAKHGERLCEHLKGMFAFSLWDSQKRRLVCGRDRFGEKPLYYAFGEQGEFIVASEIKALLASGLLTPHLDKTALAAFLRMGYVPEGLSIFSGIKQLGPAQTLIYEQGQLKISSYWHKPAPCLNARSSSDIIAEFRYLMQQAVERCLVADVEAGILLSGGLDSTTVASIAAQKGKLRSFAFGMAGDRNELPYARAAAIHYGLPLEESYIEAMDFPALLASLPEIYDEPLADTSCLPTLMLCQHVARHVKTALGGDGGDELLGGYSWYLGLDAASSKAGPVSNGWTSYAAAHFQARSFCSSAILREAGLTPWYPALSEHLADNVTDAMRMDLDGFLCSDVLKKTDRAAMHYGLELRSPFLDADLAAFLIALPDKYKISGKSGKILLRQAFAASWPEAIRERPKQGFGMHVQSLFARPEIAALRADILNNRNEPIFDILPSAWLAQYGYRTDSLAWAIFILGLWCQRMRQKRFFNV